MDFLNIICNPIYPFWEDSFDEVEEEKAFFSYMLFLITYTT